MAHFNLQDIHLHYPVGVARHSLRSTIIRKLKITPKRGTKFTLDGQYLKALSGITLKIEDGMRVGIIGANGAGKTTLLKILAGIYEPTQGNLIMEGEVANFISLGIGANYDCTGLENIRSQLLLLGYSKSRIREMTKRIIAFSELEDFIDLPLKQYSSGMCMRLNFAIMVEVEASIIIMDEWLSTGDAYFVEKAKKKLMDLISQAKIMIIGSHDLNLLTKLCTHLLWLENGQISYWGQDVAQTIELYKRKMLDRV